MGDKNGFATPKKAFQSITKSCLPVCVCVWVINLWQNGTGWLFQMGSFWKLKCKLPETRDEHEQHDNHVPSSFIRYKRHCRVCLHVQSRTGTKPHQLPKPDDQQHTLGDVKIQSTNNN